MEAGYAHKRPLDTIFLLVFTAITEYIALQHNDDTEESVTTIADIGLKREGLELVGPAERTTHQTPSHDLAHMVRG